MKQHQGNHHYGAQILVWSLMSAIIAVSVTVEACALWLPDRTPNVLSEAKIIASAPTSVQDYSGNQPVTVVPTVSASQTLLSNVSGIVTADQSGQGLVSGKAAFAVNGRAIIALSTSTPLYRNLKIGDSGEDVRAVNNELNRLGYNSQPESDLFQWSTSDGWRQLMWDNGNESNGELFIADTLWIPNTTVAVDAWTARQGTQTTAGSQVGEVPGLITALTVKNGQPSQQDRTLTVAKLTATLPAGTTTITDPVFLQQFTNSEEVTSLSPESLTAGLSATLSLSKPLLVLRVPAGAVFDVNGQYGCIAPASGKDKGKPIRMDIVGNELGVSLLKSEQVDIQQIRTVMLGETLSGLVCK
ncbi:peptidoglycan-binding domain-containing protein [Bifidobacterium eulemuris]|uniref:Peptidoglycan-binding domain 1 protein n=1 Tax=Bifidobacterium eulemuris TaxID=1765219 RepID=A0A261GCM7_9BIFI|nr:hypothetical protein [Bifidobacterium eulemuris]OZG69172.1 hypothetical protein BEUL_0578 [Bifidobacterium eulemuris]QOL31315.1 hypothetical protein BE0216_01710 [Bifidobacterium eulemuris]